VSKLLLIVAIGVPLLGTLIRVLNVWHLRSRSRTVPPGFEAVVDADTMGKMADYATQAGQLAIVHGLTNQAFVIAALFGGLLEYFDARVARVTTSAVTAGVLYFVLLSWVFAVLSLPFAIFSDFVIEQKQGFNRTTKMLFAADFFKGQMLSSLVIAVITACAFTIMKWSNQKWWLWVWLFLLAFQIFVALIAPRFIEPLFVKIRPLEDESLGQDIRAMAARASVRVDRVFQVDASRRSSHTNAYFSGFGPVKRVVLYDTLLEKLDRAEILGVLAHELGHWRLRHVLKSLILFQLVSLIGCLGAYQLIQWNGLGSLFGIASVSLFGRVALTLFLGSLASSLLTPLFSAISRKHEWEADAFACNLAQPQSLAGGLIKLARDNMSNLHPHPLYAAVFASHPPTVARVQRLRQRERDVQSAVST